MNSVKRACFRLREKRKQTAFLFFLFLLFMGLLLGCLYYESHVEEEKKKLAEKVGATLVVGRKRDFHKLPTDRKDLITEAQIHHLSANREQGHGFHGTEETKCVERSGTARVTAEDMRAFWGMFSVEDAVEFGYSQEDIDEMKERYMHIKAMEHPADEIHFREKEEVLLEGRFPEAGETDYAIISKKVAEENGKKLGDTITLTWENGNKVTLEVIGLHSHNMKDIFPMWMDPVNCIYTDIQTLESLTGEKAYNEVRFVLKDAQDMERFKARAENIFDTEKYQFLEDDAAYERGAQGIESSGQTAGIAKWIVLAAGLLVFLLLTFWQMGTRYREMGILLAMGEKKSGILLQLFWEQLIPMTAAFVIASGVYVGVGGKPGGLLLLFADVLVVFAAIMMPGVYILVRHPSELLVHE